MLVVLKCEETKKKGEEIKSGLSHGFFMLSYNCHLCLALNSTSYFHIVVKVAQFVPPACSCSILTQTQGNSLKSQLYIKCNDHIAMCND